jgi:hypothetical protein
LAEHAWTVLCESSVIDMDTQLVSLFNVLEHINIAEPVEKIEEVIESKAAFKVQMELWSWWIRSDYTKPETATIRYSLIAANGEQFPPRLFRVSLETISTAHTRLRMRSFPFRGLGLYWWIVERKIDGDSEEWEGVARVPIELGHLEPTSSPNVPEPPSEPTPAGPRESS